MTTGAAEGGGGEGGAAVAIKPAHAATRTARCGRRTPGWAGFMRPPGWPDYVTVSLPLRRHFLRRRAEGSPSRRRALSGAGHLRRPGGRTAALARPRNPRPGAGFGP